MFFLGCGWIIPGKLYGLIDLLMDLNQSLYESIDIHELSTFNLRKNVSLIKIRLRSLSFDTILIVLLVNYGYKNSVG
jgi:hypothetical protein